jgi:nucleotide-binding universal stress UspA family protein
MSPSSDPLICVAYDGSVNGHWVARYAIHIASATPARRLRVVHVQGREISSDLLDRKLEHITADSERAGVDIAVHQVREKGDVATAILEAVPAGEDALLLCGTRARARPGRLLAGTVSERLLRSGHCHVLALRVLVPGLLGAPRRLLLPVAGNPGEARSVAPFLRLLIRGAEEFRLLRVMIARRGTAELSSASRRAGLRDHGQAAVTHFENELRAVLPLEDVRVDAHVRIADDWTTPAIILAGQHKSELVLVGGTARELSRGRLRRATLERLLDDAPCDVAVYRAAR